MKLDNLVTKAIERIRALPEEICPPLSSRIPDAWEQCKRELQVEDEIAPVWDSLLRSQCHCVAREPDYEAAWTLWRSCEYRGTEGERPWIEKHNARALWAALGEEIYVRVRTSACYEPIQWEFDDEAWALISVAKEAARDLLTDPKITADQAATVKKALRALDQMPAWVMSGYVTFGVSYTAGDKDFRETRYMDIHLSDDELEFRSNGVAYDPAAGSDSCGSDPIVLRANGVTSDEYRIHEWEQAFQGLRQMGAEITVEDECDEAAFECELGQQSESKPPRCIRAAASGAPRPAAEPEPKFNSSPEPPKLTPLEQAAKDAAGDLFGASDAEE